MIELEAGRPANYVVATARGTVTTEDYREVLIPAVEAAAAAGGLRMLVVIGEDFEGYDAGAALDDMRLGFEHWREFERIGVVTDREGFRMMVRSVRFLLPGEVRLFPLADLDAARDWVSRG
jgi:hypothetical protein